MAMKATDVKRGSEVCGSDGHKIGTVAEIFASEFGEAEPGIAPPQGTSPTGTPLPFLKIMTRGNIRAIYIPADVVASVTPDRVSLRCTKQECSERYGM